jgi:hypothetical protein
LLVVDDPTILDEDDLWRRIHPGWVVPDNNRGGLRPSSQAFLDSPDGSPMSVLLAKEDSPERAMSATVWSGWSLAAIKASVARQNGQGICRDSNEEDPSHALVFGEKKKARKQLAQAAVWVVPSPGTNAVR